MPNKLNFYKNRMGNEDWICSCDEEYLMALPDIGDMVWLPFDEYTEDKDIWVIEQKYVDVNEIDYFCRPYNWED